MRPKTYGMILSLKGEVMAVNASQTLLRVRRYIDGKVLLGIYLCDAHACLLALTRRGSRFRRQAGRVGSSAFIHCWPATT